MNKAAGWCIFTFNLKKQRFNWDFSIDSVTCMNHAITYVIEGLGLVNEGVRPSLQENPQSI